MVTCATTALTPLHRLREFQAMQLHGPADPFRDELMVAPDMVHLGLYTSQGLSGYASFSPDERVLLEVYVVPCARGEAVPLRASATGRQSPVPRSTLISGWSSRLAGAGAGWVQRCRRMRRPGE